MCWKLVIFSSGFLLHSALGFILDCRHQSSTHRLYPLLSTQVFLQYTLTAHKKKEVMWPQVPHLAASATHTHSLDNLAWVLGGENNLFIVVAV